MKHNDVTGVSSTSEGDIDAPGAEERSGSSVHAESVIEHEPPPQTLASAPSLPSEPPRLMSPVKRWVKIMLSQLPADGRVRIRLSDSPSSGWDMGNANADLVGIALETPSRSTVLKLTSFIINRRELIFNAYAPCDEIRLEICVQCNCGTIRGQVDLPLGAAVTFQSEVDRTSLVGFSSFALNL